MPVVIKDALEKIDDMHDTVVGKITTGRIQQDLAEIIWAIAMTGPRSGIYISKKHLPTIKQREVLGELFDIFENDQFWFLNVKRS